MVAAPRIGYSRVMSPKRAQASGYQTQSADTHPAAERIQFEVWRHKTPAEKLRLLLDLHRTVHWLAEAGIRRRHPSATAREVFLRLAATRIDRETMLRAYGWDPATP